MFPVLFLVTVVAVTSRVLGLDGPARPRRQPPVAHRALPRRAARHALPGGDPRPAGGVGDRRRRPRLRRHDEPLARRHARRQGQDLRRQRRRRPARRRRSAPAEIEEHSTAVDLYRFANLGSTRARRVGDRASIPTPSSAPRSGTRASRTHRSARSSRSSTQATSDDGVPAVVVGTDAQPGEEVAVLDQGTRRFTIDPIEGVRTFPGMRLPKPTVFVRQDVARGSRPRDGPSRGVDRRRP